ncbi:SPW repeat domain-containing protein [Microvirga mediterraneensis]|uniref:SPW repeat protein n=1 Tax=Microvirga mediterraneensis TaxID=2754695 RepID=A0A838BTV1_9HYPH|nr:SPW repeat protein [Microvirga mediterraneensis]MBA1158967.1 SPW repeat protein [Microvirga mediterraneensis]
MASIHTKSTGRNVKGDWTIVEAVDTTVAAILILSPWLFRYSDTAAATLSAVLVGALVIIATFIRDSVAWAWHSLATLVLGLCAIIAPWALEFSIIPNAVGTHVLAGMAIVAMAAINLWIRHFDPPARAA